ncbi:TIGR03013 family XrtA/PEP-CTERM system glycosyltransferase [Photobacterium galatheae]|uniref:Sugar transferase n=1 Tax=Photobacterium galatheae TaxID=1654360 RepID=A0A066RK03_9GAMM|nr:TIGR03013 family XrtA/PEP-CTERM system glycosyltransferase [Photobacterium galatheae]KDM90755.1 sugar transferase [Photobacterium galatheae]MCM0149916.1 TIGR03013 family PEP-CTERM/XrtA system glycosyltransferase [Photobacterium galatheae]
MTHAKFHDLNLSNAVLIFSDIFVLFGIFWCVQLTTNTPDPSGDLYVWDVINVVHLIYFTLPLQLTLLSVGLYNEKIRESYSGIAARILVAISLAYMLSTSLYLITPMSFPEGFSREWMYTTALVALVLVRYIAIRSRYQMLGRLKVLVLGAGERASLINRCMRRQSDRVRIDIIGYIPMPGDNQETSNVSPIFTSNESLEAIVQQNNIKEIIIAADERRGNLPIDSLSWCKMQGIQIIEIIDFIERESGQVAVDHIHPSWVIFNALSTRNRVGQRLYWLFNCAIALFILLATWPMLIAVILMIKWEDGFNAPVLYSQERTGLKGKSFAIYKFRSMRTDAEKMGVQMASRADPRITRVGQFIRKYRLDELPQLINVLKGDMNFVGPRPERPYFTTQFEQSIPYYNHRLFVKPGLTGWAQLKYPYGEGIEDAIEKLKFDLYYIKHRSLILDILILIRTSEIVLFGKGR